MRDWKKELDVQLSLLVEEGTLTVDYKNAVLVQGFLEKFVETLLQEKDRDCEILVNTILDGKKRELQEEREGVVREIIKDIKTMNEKIGKKYRAKERRGELNEFVGKGVLNPFTQYDWIEKKYLKD